MSFETDLVKSYDAIHKRLLKPAPRAIQANDPRVDLLLAEMAKMKQKIGMLETLLTTPIHPHIPHISQQNKLTIDYIFNFVCRIEQIRHNLVRGSQRHYPIMRCRHIVYYLCANLTGKPYLMIGRLLGKKDPTTIKYATQKLELDRKSDPELDQDLCWYEAELTNHARPV